MTSVAAAFDYHTIVSPNLVGATLRNAVEPTTVTTVAAIGGNINNYASVLHRLRTHGRALCNVTSLTRPAHLH